MEQIGQIHLIIGCMFSSKTTELLRRMEKFEIIGKKCLYIKYVNDNRYSSEYLQTHSHQKSMQKAINCCDLMQVVEHTQEFEIIAIDEIQFYKNALDFVELMANNNKIVLVTGLNSDFKRNGFEVVLNLIPKCDKITYLKAICKICKQSASFSFRTTEQSEQISIGNQYISLCRKCFNNKTITQ